MKTRILAPLALALASSAHAGVVYQNDFTVGVPGSPWTGNVRIEEAAGFGRFLGRYSEVESVAMQFGPPQAGLQPGENFRYTVEFDLYVIDSWDGFEPANGPDTFMVYANESVIFDEFLAQHEMRTYREPDVGPVHMGFNAAYRDSIYRGITLTFDGGALETMKIKWRGQVMQGMSDESWGLDSVKVSYEVVPAPGSVVLVGAGALLIVRRTRR